MNCKKAKEIKMSAVLEKIGAREKRKNSREIWYLSPFRDEQKPGTISEMVKREIFWIL